jgi:hypothetical protein
MFRIIGCFALASCATSPQPPSDIPACDPDPRFDPGMWQGSAVDVPITITQSSSDGAMRFSIGIEVGGSSLDVMVDTGSTGLRILRDAVPDAAFACATTNASRETYQSGLELDGVVARATVTIGGAATPAPIPVMYVDSIACNRSDCGASSDSAETATVFGGFRAILGIGLRNSPGEIGSPIPQLPGQPSFVVRTAAYGATTGTLTIGPIDTSAFATLQLPAASDDGTLANGTPAWDDRYGIPTCLEEATSGDDYCEPGIWDTGAPATTINWPAAAGDVVLASESQIAVTIGPPATPLGAYAFTIGAVPVPGIDKVVVVPAIGEGFINLGTALFFHADALFDPLHGIVGLHVH